MVYLPYQRAALAIVLGCIYMPAQALANETSNERVPGIEKVAVWGQALKSSDAGYVSPTSILTQEDMLAINTATTEDLVKYEPSLVIRRRFIGDSNGTLGIRGSNMFQTSRSMVFADGVPLHYSLQSRWNGAPRWTMVSASEIAQVEVIYGPFSAEYSGNAIGGVVLIETAIPQLREVHINGSFFSQDFSAYGFDDSVSGFKGFASFGDKIGNASVYMSVNHLDNRAQPQTFRDSSYSAAPDNTVDTVSGGIIGNNSRGDSRLWFGDTGVVDTVTDNLKFKLGYDFGEGNLGHWKSLINVAYEDRRSSADSGNSYIKDLNGNTLWSGTDLVQNGQVFSFNSNGLNASKLERQSLSLGLRLKGELNDTTRLEVNLNMFDILKDESRSSSVHLHDPAYSPAGQISDFDNSGWSTADIKLTLDELMLPMLPGQGELITGLRYERYQLGLDVYASDDYQTEDKSSYTSRFGGETEIAALFAQTNWTLTQQWDMALGLRYEHFSSRNGYYDDDVSATPELDLVNIPSDSQSRLSPKLSVGFHPADDWLIRYSLARAYRFPIVEELFSQYEAYNTVALSNPDLEPEKGLHHNVMVDKTIEGGYLRVNIFQENVDNAIESQTDTSTNVRSFVPIDKVEVKGIELIANKSGMFIHALDVRFNMTWTDAEIVDNSSAERAADFDPADSIEGSQYPRMPEWRANVLATYHLNDDWKLSANVQYASDSFGRNDNTDTQNNVYGAQDAYIRIGVKIGYQFNDEWTLSAGVDNLTNEIDYVAHPWPGRSLYLNFAYDAL